MEKEKIKECLTSALDELYKNDISLISRRCSERSIVFKLGIYLNDIFKQQGYDVDCEYNKNGCNPKSLDEKKFNYPDLIVHKRENNTNNLLIIEIKTANVKNVKYFCNDIYKLKGFTNSIEYGYSLGAHIFISNNKCSIAWYSKGDYLYLSSYCICDSHLKEVTNNLNLNHFEKYYY